MRTQIVVGLVVVGLTAAACSRAGATAPGSPSPTAPARTHQVVLRPVTGTGSPVDGYRVRDLTNQSVDCGPTLTASPSAVDGNVLWCNPTALYAIACWPSTSSTVLCLTDARQRTLVRYAADGVGRIAAPRGPIPFALALGDGTQCTLRDGGAWSQLQQHPDWVGWYSCTRGAAVWAAPGSRGLNTTRPQWTVAVAPQSGAGAVRTVTVATAYFVGTA